MPSSETLGPLADSEADRAEYAVELKGVVRRFGERAVLDDIDLILRPSEFIAVLGQSGTGKTTLLRILAGLDAVDSGSVKIDGARSVVFQEPRLVPARTAWENVVLGQRTQEARRIAARALAEVGLAQHVDAWPKTLSGGEAQRVALARALVREPRLLLLDEPFASLDALTRIKMQALVKQLWQRHRPAVVLVTHDVDEAILLADRVLVLSHGKVTLDVRVDLPSQRSKSTAEFDQLRSRLLSELGVNSHGGDAEGNDIGHPSDSNLPGDDPAPKVKLISRRNLATIAALGAVAASGVSLSAIGPRQRSKLVVGIQSIDLRETVLASGALEGLPFDIEWALLPAAAAQLSGLYAKSLDVGNSGSTALIFEQVKPEWDDENPPFQNVATRQYVNPRYPVIVTAVRKSAGIKTLEDLRGKRWGHNYGGYNFGQYIATLARAGLTERDIQPVRFGDPNTAASAFHRGQVDVISGAPTSILKSLSGGEATILIDNVAVGVPGHGNVIARREVISDPGKSQMLNDFLTRLRQHCTWWARNVARVEEIYLRLHYSPERARYSSRAGLRLGLIDGKVQRDLQKVADLYYEFGAIPKRVQVAYELCDKYNGAQT